MVGELKDGQIREYEIHPEDFGLTMMSSRNLKVADAAESKRCCWACSTTARRRPRDRRAQRRHRAVHRQRGRLHRRRHRLAREVLASGAARAKLEAFVACTKKFA
jgi:anthranilate phosphoribosyltransferase